MLGTPEREDLLQRLRDWLIETDDELEQPEVGRLEQSLADEDGEPVPQRLVGLVQVVEGFTALRHDLKLQTKSGRQLHDQVQAAVDRLDAATQQSREAESLADQRADEAVRPVVEQLIDIEELVAGALTAADSAVAEAKRNWENSLAAEINAEFERLPRWRKALIAPWHQKVRLLVAGTADAHDRHVEDPSLRAITDGFRMVRSRLSQSLEAAHINRIDCTGKVFDPKCMRAVEVVEEQGRETDTVVEEVRPGYRYRGLVLRSAEVRVARAPRTSPGIQSKEKE